MLLFETIRPVERAVTIKMLNSRLILWAALNAAVCSDFATTVGTEFKLPSEMELHFVRNLPLVSHLVTR